MRIPKLDSKNHIITSLLILY